MFFSRFTARCIPAMTFHVQMMRHLFIKASSTPNPECQKFHAQGLTFLEGNKVLDFTSAKAGIKSPLANRLFNIPGVRAIFISHDYITVTKDEAIEWNILENEVFAGIENWRQSGEKIFDDTVQHSDTAVHPDDDEVVADIKEMLESKIRPMVQRDGGNIRYIGFEDGIIYMQMQGACSSCPSSASTLKNGIERMLMHWIPEVSGVREVLQEDSDDMLALREKTGSLKGYEFKTKQSAEACSH
jgi:Fe-S cluster biogenesis protein NfuA